MGLHLKDQQHNSQLHAKFATDLEKRLHEKGAHKVPVQVVPPAELSMGYIWASILITGGLVAIFISMLEHRDPSSVNTTFTSGALAAVGVLAIIAGIVSAIISRRHHDKGQ